MRQHVKGRTLITAGLLYLGLCFASLVDALTLDQALDLAVGYDKKYASAIFEARSAEYLPTIGRSGLLPKVSLTGFQAGNRLTQTQAGSLGDPTTTQQNYTAQSYAAQLTQPLFNLAAIASYLQSTVQEKASQHKLGMEFNDLRIKVIEAYCTLASAQEIFANTENELISFLEQEKIVNIKRLAGAASKTDLEEVVYAKLQAQAGLNEANNNVLQAKIVLENLLGIDLIASQPMIMPQSVISPNTQLHALLASAREANPKILFQREIAKSADYDHQKNKAAHTPTLDIVGFQGYQNSNTISTVGQKAKQSYLGLQLNLPLLTGGEAYGKERQSAFYAQSQRTLLESEINNTQELVKKLYTQVQTSNENLSTLKSQVQAADRIYMSMAKQQELGLKSTYDLTLATRRKFQSQRELSRSKYEQIQALKKLEVQAAIGGL